MNLKSFLNDTLLKVAPSDQMQTVFQEFFSFLRRCLTEQLLLPISQLLIFEELLECSNTTQLKNNFKLFHQHIKDHGLYSKELNLTTNQINEIELYCSRMCKSLKKKLSSSRDITFKSQIQILLSNILPLCHRSGINLIGRFSN